MLHYLPSFLILLINNLIFCIFYRFQFSVSYRIHLQFLWKAFSPVQRDFNFETWLLQTLLNTHQLNIIEHALEWGLSKGRDNYFID